MREQTEQGVEALAEPEVVYDEGALARELAVDRSLSLLARDQRAQEEAKRIREEYGKVKLHRMVLAAGRDDLERDIEKAKAAGDDEKVERLTDQKTAKWDVWEAENDEKVGKLAADLELIENPATSQAEISKLLARRGAAGTTTRKTETFVNDPLFQAAAGRSALLSRDRSSTSTTSWEVGGAAVSETDVKEKKLDKSGVTWGEGKTTEVAAGEDSASRSTKTSNRVGLDGYSRTTEETEADTTNGVSGSTSRKSTLAVGPSGVSWGDETSTKVDDHEIKEAKQRGVTRGDGKLGYGGSTTRTDGIVDADGNLTKGTKTETASEAHVMADKDAVGVGGSAKASRETVHREGLTTKVHSACDGYAKVSIVPYEGETKDFEGRFVVVLSANFSASAGAGGTLGKDRTLGAEVSVKGGLTVTARHVMTEADTKQYLADLGGVTPQNAGNGKHPEFAQLKSAWRSFLDGRGGDATSNAAAAGLLDSPEALEQMADGDELEFTVTGSATAKGTAGANVGIFTAGVEGSATKAGTLTYKVAKVGTQTLITVSVEGEDGREGGASLGAAGVTSKVTHGTTTTSGRSVTFHLNADELHHAAEIKSATSAAELDALVAKYPGLLKEHEKSESETEKTTVGLDVGKVGFEMGGSGTVGKKIKVDEEGKETQTDTGASSAGAKVKVGDMEFGDKRTDQIATTVGPDNTATGDLSTTDSEFDLDKSLMDWDDRKRQSGAVGTATGSTSFKPVDATEQSGMLLSDDDYNQIIYIATQEPAEWDKHWASTRHKDDWKQLRREIAAANGDKKKVGEALAKFVGEDDHGRKELVQNVVRKPLADGQGGVMYEFPDGLGALKSEYVKLVFNDPAKEAADLWKAGDKPKAAAVATKQVAALDSLYNALHGASDKFAESGKVAAYGEMLSRINQRKKELGQYLGHTDQERDTKRYNDLLTACMDYKEQENQAYAKIVDLGAHKARDIVPIQNELRALYQKWDPEYAEMAELGDVWGFDRKTWTKYKPDKHKWKQTYEQHVDPTGKTDEEQLEEKLREDQAREMTERLQETSVASIEAKAASQQKQFRVDRNAAAAKQRPLVNAAKNKAALAAAWHNRATKDGLTIKPAAQQKAGEGWSKWAQATEREKLFDMVAGNDLGMDAGVNMNAEKAIALFQEAEQAFNEGKALNAP